VVNNNNIRALLTKSKEIPWLLAGGRCKGNDYLSRVIEIPAISSPIMAPKRVERKGLDVIGQVPGRRKCNTPLDSCLIIKQFSYRGKLQSKTAYLNLDTPAVEPGKS
jgi:hypothetical protein